MRIRSGIAAAVCAVAVAWTATVPTCSAFLVPATPTTTHVFGTPGLVGKAGLTTLPSRLGSPKVALGGRVPATIHSLPISGRRTRRSHPTRTSMVFGGGGGGRGGGGGFRLDPGTIGTITFGLLLVFAPGFVFGAFNTFFLVVTVGPILFSLGINLYNKFNVIDAPCPVCGVELQGLKNSQNQCPSCGAMLIAQDGVFEAVGSGYVRDEAGAQQKFSRMGDSSVIDVDAIDVD